MWFLLASPDFDDLCRRSAHAVQAPAIMVAANCGGTYLGRWSGGEKVE
jgi:hypothetical protein